MRKALVMVGAVLLVTATLGCGGCQDPQKKSPTSSTSPELPAEQNPSLADALRAALSGERCMQWEVKIIQREKRVWYNSETELPAGWEPIDYDWNNYGMVVRRCKR